MESIENLVHLEEAVEKLLVALKSMKQEKLVLEARVESRDQEISVLKQQLESHQGERVQVQQRVAGLIDSIEKWERLNEDKVSETPSSPVVAEKTLF